MFFQMFVLSETIGMWQRACVNPVNMGNTRTKRLCYSANPAKATKPQRLRVKIVLIDVFVSNNNLPNYGRPLQHANC